MRRVLLFAAFLLLLGLTTATAASFDVQAEDITSFSQPVSIAVPEPDPPRPTYSLSGEAPFGALEYPAPTEQSSVITGKFQPSPDLIDEERAPGPGQVVYFMRWATGEQVNGIRFDDAQVTLELYSPGGLTGTISAGLFDCPRREDPLPDEPPDPPFPETSCTLLTSWDEAWDSGPPELIMTSGVFDGFVAPGNELRLKVVNAGSAEWSVQWGFKEQNRYGNLSVATGVTA